MKNCIIFGGSRFLGVHLTLRLQAIGYKVFHFRRGVSRPPISLPGVTLIQGDRNSPDDIVKAFLRNYDLVIDLSGYELRQVCPIFDFRAHFRRYLFCSSPSAAEAGDEKSYGGKKRAIEGFLHEEAHRGQSGITIFRPQGIFGKFDWAQPGLLFRAMRQNEMIRVSAGQLNARLNLLDVKDFVSALVQSIDREFSFGQTYHLANEEPLSLRELGDRCARLAGKPSPLEEASGTGPDWWPERDLIADTEKARRDLGLIFTPLSSGLEECARYREPTIWSKVAARLGW